MREITEMGDVAACCAEDTLTVWAAQGLDGRSRAWVSDDRRAVAVAAPGLFMRDRLAIWGAPDAAAPLLRETLDEVGTHYRAMGSPELLGALVQSLPRLHAVARFGWMESRTPPVGADAPETPAPGARAAEVAAADTGVSEAGAAAAGVSEAGARQVGAASTVTLGAPPVAAPVSWLTDTAWPEVTDLLEAGYPGAWARPGEPGVERWAGVRDADGTLAAVGAFACTAPTIGLLAGIAVHPEARGRGLGRRICAFLIAEAQRVYGTAALMVGDDNHAAIRLYRGMGLSYRTTQVAAVEGT